MNYSDIDETGDSNLLNLTPLIDVVFVILISFILMAPLLKLDRIELSSSASPELKEVTSTDDKSSPIVIKVFADNSILINERRVKLSEVDAVFKSLKNEYPQKNLRLFQDATAHFGTYQKIKSSAEVAGFKELDVLVKPSY